LARMSIADLKKKLGSFPLDSVCREFLLRQPDSISEEDFLPLAKTLDELLLIDLQRAKGSDV
jgi:hypothetical protein